MFAPLHWQAAPTQIQANPPKISIVATEQPAAGTKVTKTEKPASGGGTSTKGGGGTKGDATTPKGEVSKPEGNNSDRGASVTTGGVKNTRDIVDPTKRQDNVKNQKDRDVTPVKK